VKDQPEQGDQQEPIAPQRDQRGDIEAAEVPIAAKQREAGPKAALDLDRFAR